jgi:hypothetical protein
MSHVFHRAKHWESKVCLASFLGGGTTNHFRTIGDSLLHMESALLRAR